MKGLNSFKGLSETTNFASRLSQNIIIFSILLAFMIGCVEKPKSSQESNISSDETIKQERFLLEQERLKLAKENERENNRQALLFKIKSLEQQKDLYSQKLFGLQEKISNMEVHENKLVSELNEFNRNVKSFMMNHKSVLACMGALGMSMDESNEYSKDAKDIAEVAAVFCGIAVLGNDEFRNEVISTVDEITKADSYAKNLKAQIYAVRSQLTNENQLFEAEQIKVAQLVSEIQNYQTQLVNV